MAFRIVVGGCCGCGRVFGFNPDLVPSARIQGKKEPVCPACLKIWNAERVKNGLPAIPALPGAYEAAEVGD